MFLGLPSLGLAHSKSAVVTEPPAANRFSWYRKGSGITSAADAVSAWADQVSGANYAQATAANQPTLQPGGTILFDGTSDWLRVTGIALAQPYTRCLRFRQKTWTSGRYVFDGATQNTGLVLQTGVSPALSMYASSATVNSNSAATLDTWVSLVAVYNGSGSFLRIGSTSVGPAQPGTSALVGYTLGASGGLMAALFSNIEVAEEIVYNVALDVANQNQVIAYLNTL